MKLIKVKNNYILQDIEMNKKIFNLLDHATEFDSMDDIIESVENILFNDNEFFDYQLLYKCNYNDENEYFLFIKNLLNNEILKVCIFEIF